jgi:hypothetical protein
MKMLIPRFFLFSVSCACLFIACSKDNPTKTPAVAYGISFRADTMLIKLPVVTARVESIGGLSAVTIEGKSPDTASKKHSIVLRLLGDTARAYSNTDVLIAYKDAAGDSYSGVSGDTLSKVIVTKMQRKQKGIVEGSFELLVKNNQKATTIRLSAGKFTVLFED